MPASTPLRPLVDTVEQMSALDSVAKAYGKFVRDLWGRGAVKDAISGTWFGHPVHPPLTDVVTGSFLGVSLLDLLGGDGKSSQRLLGVGLAAAVPTALTGANDWADTEIADEAVRRVGLVHATANGSAVGLYAASLAARRHGARGRGVALALAGAGVMAVAGYLGGHMSYTRGVGPNQTAFDPGPDEWTPVGDGQAFPDGEPRAALAQDTPVLLLRHGDGIHAIHNRCSHRGCLLSDGEAEGHVVTCPCHGSQFDVRDGSVIRGPATAGQPAFDARESDGKVEIKLVRRG
jgi:nitrite reductase/ring-hydroxylating ferredoxin subunit